MFLIRSIAPYPRLNEVSPESYTRFIVIDDGTEPGCLGPSMP